MATNKTKVMLPDTMGREGIALMQAREDIETIVYPTMISQAELLPRLADVAGIALSLTPFRQPEMDASPAMQVVARIGVGYDAVEVPALTARGVPLMVAGTANSISVAEQAFHLIIALAKKNRAMDALVRDNKWGDRREITADGAGRQNRADRRLRAHRHPDGAALCRLRYDRTYPRPLHQSGQHPLRGI